VPNVLPSSEIVKSMGISEPMVAAMFDRISDRYDFLNRLLSARQDLRWRKILVSMIPTRKGGTYLDMATGTGDVLLAATKSHPEYATFIGADISKGMLDVADKKAQAIGLSNRTGWQVMSAETITLDSNSVDCASISFGLRNVINKEKSLTEFARVLKPGGLFLILEFFTPTSGFMSRAFQFYFHHVLPKIGRLFSEKEAYAYLPKSVATFYSPRELRDSLRSKGFTVEKEINFLFGACRLVKSRRS
jgi:demethylmenaquinone methyltransferase/2-methoxy-6-polyprenyl-1,4-benzoquinol methylase